MNKFEIPVPGTTHKIKSGTIYTVEPKYDPDAPDGFQEHRTTKMIHPQITNEENVPFNQASDVWDTGLYTTSPCLRTMQPEEKKTYLNLVRKHIYEPIVQLRGEEFLDHRSSNTKLDEHLIKVGISRAFNTDDPEDLMDLFFICLGKKVAPKAEESSPIYKGAQFVIVNQEETVSRKQEKEFEDNKAIGEFFGLMKTDKKKLIRVLDYLGISAVTERTDETTLNSVFNQYLKRKSDGMQNGKHFLSHLKRFSTEKGEEELYIYENLKKLYKKGVVKDIRNEFYIDDINIGNSLKHGATFVVGDKELRKKVLIDYAEEK